MKQKNKIIMYPLKFVLSLIVIIFGIFLLTGCGKTETTMWLSGTTMPSNSLSASDGSIYLDTSKYDLYQKEDGTWKLIGNISGEKGTDGITPTISISDNGYWIINGKETNVSAIGKNGQNGSNGTSSTVSINDDGYWVINGKTTSVKAVGINGTNGTDGASPTIEINGDGYWVINNEPTNVKATGESGESVFVKYSQNPDGTDYEDEYSDGYNYIGIATGKTEPTNKSAYIWFLLSKPARKSIKVLAIGNSFSLDAITYLWDIFKDGGYDDVIIGNLYIGGCSLDTHWTNMQNNNANYKYYKNTTGTMKSTANSTILSALTEEDWDVITIQQVSNDSGVSSTYSNLDNIIDYINTNKTNENAKIYWHMTWAYQSDASFGKYRNQVTMFNAIQSTAIEKIVTNSNIIDIIPSGTAVQNLRASSLGDTLTRDGVHMSLDIGRYLVALTWYAKLSGNSIDDIDYLPDDTSYANNINTNMALIKGAVKYAIKNPFITISEPEEPIINPSGGVITGDLKYLTMSQDDIDFLTSQGKNSSNYKKINLEWTGHAYFNSSSNVNTLVFTATASSNYNVTRLFTKEQLPNGSIISLASGYRYRPDAFITIGQVIASSDRPANVKASVVVVDDTWWDSWNYRIFNLFKSDNSTIDFEECSALNIYVPINSES